tara:strand:- start:5214 stop:5594 length:381 start_codon:yes stop_codon:yes gene_type:complete
MRQGRPTKYSPTIQKQADQYLLNYQDCGDVVPTIEGLADELSIARSTLYLWAETIELFSDTLESINAKQARRLVSGGLTNELNSTITKLMLANHGYREKTEVDNRSTDGSMSPQKIERVIVQAEHI